MRGLIYHLMFVFSLETMKINHMISWHRVVSGIELFFGT